MRGLRRRTLLCGVGLTVLWLLLLRWGLGVLSVSPLLTASAALGTVVGCFLLEQRLYQTAHPCEIDKILADTI